VNISALIGLSDLKPPSGSISGGADVPTMYHDSGKHGDWTDKTGSLKTQREQVGCHQEVLRGL